MDVQHLLTDNVREYCGRPLAHPFELFLAIDQIEHWRAEIGSPQTNGFCERTLKSELTERFESHGEAKMELFDYIEVFYNQKLRHSTLGQFQSCCL